MECVYKVEMPNEIRLIENCRTTQFCQCVANGMIVYHKSLDFESNFYQQVSFLVADAFLSISGNAFRFDAKCVVGLEIHTHLLVYTHSPQKNCHFYIYLSTSIFKYFLCSSMALLVSNGIATDVKQVNIWISELYTRKQSLQSEAWKIVGRKFNLTSVSELRKVRFDIFCANVQGIIVVLTFLFLVLSCRFT